MPTNQEPLDAAQEAGAKAIVVTVDQEAPYYDRQLHDRNLSASSTRRRTRRSAKPDPYRMASRRLWYEWKLFDQLREYIRVPMLAKGVLRAEDAERWPSTEGPAGTPDRPRHDRPALSSR